MSLRDSFVLGVDLDDCVFQYAKKLWEYVPQRYPELYGVHFVPAKTWDFKDSEPWPFASREDFMRSHTDLVEDMGLAWLEGNENASEVLWRLSELGVRIHIISNRFIIPGTYERVVSDTMKNLKRRNIPFSALTFTDRKDRVKVDVLIDDSPANLTAYKSAGMATICYDQPYNQDWHGVRAKNWLEVENLVKKRFALWQAGVKRS